jgi:hypothetical protein
MPKISNLFKEKLYVFGNQPEVFSSEKDLIKDIFFQEGLEESKEIKFIDANIDNDLFLVKNSEGNFYIKLSLDPQNSNLDKEFNIIYDNIEYLITPFAVSYGFSEKLSNIEFSIAAEIPAPNLLDVGVANFFEKPDMVKEFFERLSKFRPNSSLSSFQQYCDPYLSFDILKTPDVEVSWIENHRDIKKIVQEQVVYLQRLLKEKLRSFSVPAVHVCHGNLNPSTLLIFGDYMHAINWEKAYHGDLYFELCNLRYELFFDEVVEKQILRNFTEFSNHKISQEQQKDYILFSKYFNLLKIMVEYLNETYVLRANRKNKILNCAIKLSKNYDAFYQLPDFDKKLKPIAEFFVESVI